MILRLYAVRLQTGVSAVNDRDWELTDMLEEVAGDAATAIHYMGLPSKVMAYKAAGWVENDLHSALLVDKIRTQV